MTKIDLQRVLDLDAQATDGPWRTDSTECEVGIIWGAPRQLGGGYLKQPMVTDFVVGHGDAELIAEYRTAAPAMAKALQAVLELHYERPNSASALYPDPLCACGLTKPCSTVKAIHYYLGEQE